MQPKDTSRKIKNKKNAKSGILSFGISLGCAIFVLLLATPRLQEMRMTATAGQSCNRVLTLFINQTIPSDTYIATRATMPAILPRTPTSFIYIERIEELTGRAGGRVGECRREGSKTLTTLGKIYFVKTTKKNLQDPTEPEKTYAQAQHRAVMNLDELGEHIAAHGCNYDAGDVTAIVKKTMNCIRELLCDGYILRLGDLGRFFITVQSRGVCESVIDPETKQKPVFTANDIKSVKVNWARSGKMESSELMRSITFEETITTKARAAMIKAKKAAMAAGTYDKDVEFVTDSGSTGENTGDSDINDDGYEVHE